MAVEKYVQVGVGGRARFFYEAIVGDFRKQPNCLPSVTLTKHGWIMPMKIIQENYNPPVSTYKHTEFEEMIKKEKPGLVLVTSSRPDLTIVILSERWNWVAM